MTVSSTIKIVVYTNAGTRFIKPLLAAKLNIVGIAEQNDHVNKLSPAKKFFDYLYWLIFKFSKPQYNSRIAKSNNINYIETDSPNSGNFKKWLHDLSPDIMLLYQAPILKPDVFNIPKYGTVNLHPSLLPKYRGPHPIFWMHYNYDLHGGCTLHYIDQNIDTGPIIDQKKFDITPGASEYHVEKFSVEKIGIPLFIKFVLNEEFLHSFKQSDTNLNKNFPYAKRPLFKQYFELIDWERWKIEHTWHVLRCFDFWSNDLKTNNLLDNFYNWHIGDYIKCETTGKPGSFAKKGMKCFFIHKEGIITIRKTFSVKMLIKYLLNKII